MSRIEKLIAEQCPRGVQFRRVEDAVASTLPSKGVMRENYKLGTRYPIVDQGQTYIAGYTDDNSLTIPKGEYIVFGDHTRAVKWVDFEFAPGADGTKVLQAASGVIPKFLYYAIASLEVPSRGYNRHWTVLRELRIPIPPLEIQREIVKMLDSFTQLTADLETELSARRKQYAYYRDVLLACNKGSNTKRSFSWMTLGELGVFVRGSGIQKSDFTESGVGCIHYGQIHTHYGVWADKTKSFVDNDFAARLRKAQKGDLVIATTSEDDAAVAKAVAWIGQEEVAVSTDAYIFKHSLNPKYISYFFQTEFFQLQKRPHITGTKVRRISGESLAKIRIPVPPLDEQARVVAVLDKFEELLNDPAIGLPAEIKVRRQQYEHYRSRLLTFKEAA
ncbi:restriction endonuclease subunit S [Citrobacter braakii]